MFNLFKKPQQSSQAKRLDSSRSRADSARGNHSHLTQIVGFNGSAPGKLGESSKIAQGLYNGGSDLYEEKMQQLNNGGDFNLGSPDMVSFQDAFLVKQESRSSFKSDRPLEAFESLTEDSSAEQEKKSVEIEEPQPKSARSKSARKRLKTQTKK